MLTLKIRELYDRGQDSGSGPMLELKDQTINTTKPGPFRAHGPDMWLVLYLSIAQPPEFSTEDHPCYICQLAQSQCQHGRL